MSRLVSKIYALTNSNDIGELGENIIKAELKNRGLDIVKIQNGAPDFLVLGTKAFIEVKTGYAKKLTKGQKIKFKEILELDFKIYILTPIIEYHRNRLEILDIRSSKYLHEPNKRGQLREPIRFDPMIANLKREMEESRRTYFHYHGK